MKDIINLLNEYGIMGTVQNVLLALIILFVGLFVIRKFLNVIDKQLSRKYEDPTLVGFIMSLTGWSLKILLFITVASTVGIQTTSFVAILGAAGLAIGLALQGTLGNFAGGVLVLLFKPFKVGDLIEANGELGVVKEVQIFNTIMTSPENKQLILPNGAIMNGNIKNYSAEGMLRIDLKFGISYDSDIKKAKEILLEVMNSDANVLKDPAPFVGVGELGSHAIILDVRPYSTPENYWNVYFRTYEEGKIALDKAGISIPLPQMDVHFDKNIKFV